MIADFGEQTLPIVLYQHQSDRQIENCAKGQNKNQKPLFPHVVLDPVVIFYVHDPENVIKIIVK